MASSSKTKPAEDKRLSRPFGTGRYGEKTRRMWIPEWVTHADIDRLIIELKAERAAEEKTQREAK